MEENKSKIKIILSIIGFLLLIAVVAAGVFLVRQRQEIRKEAEEKAEGVVRECIDEFEIPTPTVTPTSTPAEICEYPEPPTLETINKQPFENPVYFKWQTESDCLDYQSPVNGLKTYYQISEGVEEENIINVIDGEATWITVKARAKNFVPPLTSCEECAVANLENTCCPTEWIEQSVCVACKNPINIQATGPVKCQDNTEGTKITWDDQSDYEDGFVVYYYRGGDPHKPRYVGQAGSNTAEYIDCDRPYYEGRIYSVHCYTEICGGGPTTPTATPTQPTGSPAPFSCLDLGGPENPEEFKAGDEIALTCIGSADKQIVRFEFRFSQDNGATWQSLTDSGAEWISTNQWQGTVTYTIPDPPYGCYRFECRPCLDNACTDWPS